MKKKGLGKGLDALIPPSEDQRDQVFLCPVNAISPLPDQPRRRFDPQHMDELVQTVREKGVLSPVLIRQTPDGYQLISGERRWRASKIAGLERIPAIVLDVSDREALEMSLIENLQREDLTPLEEARAYHALVELYGITHEDLSHRLGKDRSTITNAIRLLKLSGSVQEALENGIISAGHARCLLSVPVEMQDALLDHILTKDLSVRSTERLVKDFRGSKKKERPKKELSDPHIEEIRNRIRAALSTQVRIVDGKRKGKIVIEYYGAEDLERIAKRLSSPD